MMLYRQVQQYFNHWKHIVIGNRAKVMKQAHVFITRSCRNYFMNYFNAWRNFRFNDNKIRR